MVVQLKRRRSKTVTFMLKEGLQCSETGEPVTASDFVFGWQRAVSPKTE
ncbi:hypothetical protein O9992_20950 [Vibrio lentus]|nr:hypothetical protein [Vibrio lentus]